MKKKEKNAKKIKGTNMIIQGLYASRVERYRVVVLDLIYKYYAHFFLEVPFEMPIEN